MYAVGKRAFISRTWKYWYEHTLVDSVLPFGDEALQDSGEDTDKGESSSYSHNIVAGQVLGDGGDVVDGHSH
jgi:hypothetical protein